MVIRRILKDESTDGLSTEERAFAIRVGAHLATLRKARKLTEAEVARSVKVTTDTIRAIERGVRTPRPRLLRSLVGVMLVTPVDFFRAIEPPLIAAAMARALVTAK